MFRQLRVFALALVVCVLWPGMVNAAGVRINVRDQMGKPVKNAVLALRRSGGHLRSVTEHALPRAIMDQRNEQFVPRVLAVRAGTAVSFPNSDNIHHDVYSFSPAKMFELPLYSGTPTNPVTFDKPGVVTLGCNIHDWMLGYIYVADTPFFTKVQSPGRAHLDDVPAGRYELRIWHPRLQASRHELRREITLQPNETFRASYTLHLTVSKTSLHDPGKLLERLQRKFKRFH